MATHTSMLHVRVDDEMKERASAALETMGLSLSDAVRLLLHRVVADQSFPLELKVPNAASRAAMAEADAIVESHVPRFAEAGHLLADLEKTSAK